MALARGKGGTNPLFEVLNSGPLSPDDARAYAGVYKRGMEEVERLLAPTKAE
jgi:hypothetical protein